ncbi:MAG: outer membrane beta-barrel protein [Candidatus Aminicenantes bacterium]|nr:outer membrane beta-barrel protein [Candidatus Aminicenantes bacterium]
MKRLTLLFLTVLAIVSFTSARTRVSFQLSGGLNYATGGDLARGIRGYNAYLKNEFNAADGFEVPVLGFQFAGEFLYHFSDRIAAGLSVGYFEHMKESKTEYEYIGIIDVGETIRPKFRVFPITADVHYDLSLGGSLHLDLSTGAGCYLVWLNYIHRQDLSLFGFSGSDVYSFESFRTGFGVHGGIGLEWVIDPKFSVLLNITGRLASVTGFIGDWTEKGRGDFWDFEESGTNHRIWYVRQIVYSRTYDVLAFDEKEPEEDEYENIRQARLGLSGFAVTLGFKIGLF